MIFLNLLIKKTYHHIPEVSCTPLMGSLANQLRALLILNICLVNSYNVYGEKLSVYKITKAINRIYDFLEINIRWEKLLKLFADNFERVHSSRVHVHV